MAIREGRWRCPRCNEENLGRHLECTSCGDTRDDGVEFYLPGDQPEVSDEDLLARAGEGPDRLCDYCDASNPASAEECEGCGAPLGARRRCDGSAPVEKPKPPPPKRREPRARRRRRSRKTVWGCLTLLVLGVLGLVAGRLWQREVTLTVSSVEWRRTVEAERLTTLTETGWEGELPADARPLRRRRAVREQRQVQVGTRTRVVREEVRVEAGTERVKVGVRDLGNGFFEDVYEDRPVYERQIRTREVVEPEYRQEPVYATEVTYQVDRWKVVRTAEAGGTDLSPRWPELESGERERAGSRTESYSVRFKGPGGKIYRKSVPEPLFARYPPGSRHVAKIDSFGSIRTIRRR